MNSTEFVPSKPECLNCLFRIQMRMRIIELERQLKEVTEERDKLSRTDKMTGLANKDRMNHEIQNRLDVHLHDPDTHCAVIFVDLDGFKKINDTDHLFGDQLIVEFARFLEAEVRPGDIVARFGGDEFYILAPSTTKEEAEGICANIQQGLKEYRFGEPRDTPVYLSASTGVSSTSEGFSTLKEMVEAADSRMSELKFERKAKAWSTSQ